MSTEREPAERQGPSRNAPTQASPAAAVNRQKVSIGLLAHNEEEGIGRTIRSLFEQDVLRRHDCQIVIVANGCSDRTASVARALIEECQRRGDWRGVARVEEIETPGKANAWNEFVHRLSDRGADCLVLMDADIVLGPSAIATLVERLQVERGAAVCVDTPRKDARLAARRGLLQGFMMAATPRIDPAHIPLCGQLYCARADELRRVRLPREIQVDDGFLRALLLTRGFTQPEDPGRIVLAPTAAHTFAPVTGIGELLRHERWIVAGSIVNMLLFDRFHREAGPDRSAMALMSEWAAQDPAWLPRFVAAEAERRGWALLPRSWWLRRWRQLRKRSGVRRLAFLPVFAAAWIVDAVVFLAAIAEVRRGRACRYWAAPAPASAVTKQPTSPATGQSRN